MLCAGDLRTARRIKTSNGLLWNPKEIAKTSNSKKKVVGWSRIRSNSRMTRTDSIIGRTKSGDNVFIYWYPTLHNSLEKEAEETRGWILKVKFSIIIWETESEGLSHFPHHHPTERSKPEIQTKFGANPFLWESNHYCIFNFFKFQKKSPNKY